RVGGHSDLDDTTSGTIYRIAPKGFKSQVPKLDLTTTEGQVEALRSPAGNVRHSGFVLLQAQGTAAVPAVATLLKDANPFIAARAVWLLAQMGEAGVALVQPLLDSPDETRRLVAYRALRRAGVEVLAMAARLAGDHSAAIRREVALTMHDVSLEQSRSILTSIAQRFDGHDRSYLEAFGTGCSGKEREIFAALAKDAGPAEDWSNAFAALAWRLHSPDAVADFKARALSAKLSNDERKRMMDALAFVQSPAAAEAMVALALDKTFPHQATALWWLFNRKDNTWREYGLEATMKQRGLYDPDAVTLSSIVSPDPAEHPLTLPPAADIASMKGDVERGKLAISVCYTCHQIGGQGVEFGPDLTQFGKTQTREVVLGAILNPSADIAHGYEGSRVTTTDGLTIDGILVTSGDPVSVRSVAGQTQIVPRKRVKQISKLKHSLMFPPDMLGLTPQALADIVAYLQSDALK
ncbi:MAG: dehydrogenase, partial [Roseimicrobium sp.]